MVGWKKYPSEGSTFGRYFGRISNQDTDAKPTPLDLARVGG
jgi:hypothetical protein